MRPVLAIVTLLFVASCVAAPDRSGQAFLTGPHAARLSRIVAALKGQVLRLDGGVVADVSAPPLPTNWRAADANLYLSEQGPAQADAAFYFPGLGAFETRIFLTNLRPVSVKAQIICDAEARVVSDASGSQHMRAGKTRSVTLPGRGDAPLLVLGPEVTTCEITWGEGRFMRLLREETARPELARIDARQDLCATPNPAGLDALEQVFYSDRWLSQTCVMPQGDITLLPGELEALNARIRALTGREMTREQLMSGNPDQPIDFSNAPDLDLIYLSYLHIRADYSGHLLLRMLKHHAQNGTIIRILVTDILTLGLERRALTGLAATYPNVQLQFYRWGTPGLYSVGDFVDSYQNSQHIKIFAAVSSEPGGSSAIVGGRNIHDGFFFDEAFDIPDRPDVRSYDTVGELSLGFLSFYVDFEVEMRDQAVVEAIAAHLSTFWHRDGNSLVARPMAVNGPEIAPATGGLRHFMSLPWADGFAQESYFIDLLDAAQEEIVLVSPYLYPIVGIENALHRARARGVRVLFVSRVSSTDPPGIFTAALAEAFIARCADVFEIVRFEAGDKLLHSKIILIDARLTIVTSSNQNTQSFRNDTENGIVVLDRGFASRVRQVVDGYVANSVGQCTGGDLNALSRFFDSAPWWKQFF